MTRLLMLFIVLCSLLGTGIPVRATPFFTSVVQQDSVTGRWQYDYTVTNDLSASAVTEFTIYFNPELYQSLEVVSAVPGWFEQVAEPALWSATGPQDGFFNAISNLGSEIRPLVSLGGFSASFDWLGLATPLANDFQDFTYVTVPYVGSPSESVPEPGTFLLLGAGLSCFAAWRRLRSRAESKGYE